MSDKIQKKLDAMKDAMARSVLITVAPTSNDELYMLADALRVWSEHPALQNEVVALVNVDPQPMLRRIAMALALIKFGVNAASTADVPDGYGSSEDE